MSADSTRPGGEEDQKLKKPPMNPFARLRALEIDYAETRRQLDHASYKMQLLGDVDEQQTALLREQYEELAAVRDQLREVRAEGRGVSASKTREISASLVKISVVTVLGGLFGGAIALMTGALVLEPVIAGLVSAFVVSVSDEIGDVADGVVRGGGERDLAAVDPAPNLGHIRHSDAINKRKVDPRTHGFQPPQV